MFQFKYLSYISLVNFNNGNQTSTNNICTLYLSLNQLQYLCYWFHKVHPHYRDIFQSGVKQMIALDFSWYIDLNCNTGSKNEMVQAKPWKPKKSAVSHFILNNRQPISSSLILSVNSLHGAVSTVVPSFWNLLLIYSSFWEGTRTLVFDWF